MESQFGIKGSCLDWFKSYLHERPQYVFYDGTSSIMKIRKYGLPQGSKIAPPLYNVYSSPIFPTITAKQCSSSGFADDKGVYISFNLQNAPVMLAKLQAAINAVSEQLSANKLKLNPAKTEFIVFTKQQANGDHVILKQLATNSINVDGHWLVPTDTVKFLGVALDEHLSLKQHIGQSAKTSLWQLAEIRRIRPRLDQATTETIVRAFVMSRLDYCNSIYYGLPATATKPLRRVFNASARSVTLTRKYDHITPVLIQLHWLPIAQRLLFKLLVMVFRCLQGTAPTYLSDQLSLADSSRLSAQRILRTPMRNRSSFAHNASSAWNNLPIDLRTSELSLLAFRKKLKTMLFQQAFGHLPQ